VPTRTTSATHPQETEPGIEELKAFPHSCIDTFIPPPQEEHNEDGGFKDLGPGEEGY